MGHHRGDYCHGGRATGFGEPLARLPRGVKAVLALVALLVVLAGLAVVVAAVLVVIKLAGGGTLPGALQNAWELFQRNLPALLNFWKAVQGLAGK